VLGGTTLNSIRLNTTEISKTASPISIYFQRVWSPLVQKNGQISERQSCTVD